MSTIPETNRIAISYSQYFFIFCLTIVNASIYIGFALQYSLLTPYTIELGISPRYSSLVWLCGPVTGMIVQPVVGALSDRYGAIEHFLIVGVILSILSNLIVAFSSSLFSSAQYRLFLFVLGFWLIDFANNTNWVILRSSIPRVFRKSTHLIDIGYFISTVWIGVGLTIGYSLGHFPFESMTWFRRIGETSICHGTCLNVKIVFTMSSLSSLIFGCISLYCLWGKTETSDSSSPRAIQQTNASLPLLQSDGSSSSCVSVSSNSENSTDIRIITQNQRPLWPIFLATGLAWFGWISLQIYQTHYVAVDVLKTTPGSPAYTRGIHFACLGLICNSILLVLFILFFLPFFTYHDENSWKRLVSVWEQSSFGFAIWLILIPVILLIWPTIAAKDFMVFIWMVFFGPLYAVQITVPYALLAKQGDIRRQGLLQGSLNIALCLAQFTVALMGGFIIDYFKTDVSLLIISSLGALICGVVLEFYTLRKS